MRRIAFNSLQTLFELHHELLDDSLPDIWKAYFARQVCLKQFIALCCSDCSCFFGFIR